MITADDVELLENEGMQQIWVTRLEEGEIGEDEAVLTISREMGCGCMEIRPAPGGRANLFATEDCCVLVDEELLRQINCTASIVIATLANFAFVKSGQRIASVKSTPFVVPKDQLDAVQEILRERGPILQARPIRTPSVALLYTDPTNGERARQLFEPIVRQRLDRLNVREKWVLSSIEEVEPLTRAFGHLLRAKPTVLLVASTTAPAGPEDAVGRAMVEAGCHLEKFLAPVEPGNLLLLGYRDQVPVVSAPGCFRSAKPNVVDLVLPPMLARYRVSGWEVAGLGHGGLLA